MKKILFTFTVLLFTILLTVHSAMAFSLLGAETLNVGEKGVRVGAGFPALYGAYHMPVTDRFEIAPKFSFFYGWDTTVPDVGDTFGLELKFRIIESGNFNLAVLVDPAMLLIYHPDLWIGMQIGGPGIITSYRFQGKYYFFGGLAIPFGFIFYTKNEGTPNFIAGIPIMFKMGGEFAVTQNINIFLSMEFGPDIAVESGHSSTEFKPLVGMGITTKL
jgi:hypothetical protein